MPPLKGFVGPAYADSSRSVDCQESYNLFIEKVESGSKEAVLRLAPGKRQVALALDQRARGCFAQDGRAFFVFGITLNELTDHGDFETAVDMTLRGTVASDDYPVSIASNGQGGNQLFIVSAGYGYIFNLSTNILAGIGGGFPSNASGAGFLNGKFYTTSGVFIYESALEDGTTWSAASKFQRSAASDDLQALIFDDHKVAWLIGSKTTEPLYDAGLTTFSLAPIVNAFVPHGTESPGTAVRFDNTVFFLASSEHGARYAVIISGGQAAQRISTHALEARWRTYDTVRDAYAWTYSDAGHAFVVLTFPSAGESWCYDASTGAWHRLGRWSTEDGSYHADDVGCHCYAFNRHLVGSFTAGVVYEQSRSLYADDDGPLRWLRRTPHMATEDRRRVSCPSIELIAEMGSALITGQGSDPMVGMRYSDDNGNTWSYTRNRSLGTTGHYKNRAIWNRNGRFYERVWEFFGSEPIPTTLIGANVETGG